MRIRLRDVEKCQKWRPKPLQDEKKRKADTNYNKTLNPNLDHGINWNRQQVYAVHCVLYTWEYKLEPVSFSQKYHHSLKPRSCHIIQVINIKNPYCHHSVYEIPKLYIAISLVDWWTVNYLLDTTKYTQQYAEMDLTSN